MSESFFALTPEDQLEAIRQVSNDTGRPTYLLEKDIWVVWSLNALFTSKFNTSLVFKGGTSLSKAHKAIDRFSEDINITYDIRALAPDLVAEDQQEASPPSRSQANKWTDDIRKRLSAWVEHNALPIIVEALNQAGHSATAQLADNAFDSIIISYGQLTEGQNTYVKPEVKLEFGARSTGEPAEVQEISTDMASYIPELEFPKAHPRVMCIERTFWEKATAVHVYCHRHRWNAERFARHWYDLASLDKKGLAEHAINNRAIAKQVARHKSWFFRSNDYQNKPIDYMVAINGDLQLVPKHKDALTALRVDYEQTKALIFDHIPFDELIENCQSLEDKCNRGN